jgi:hypothetical protein
VSEQNSKETVLQNVDPKRRDFLKSVLAAGFAAPLVATFSIDALTAESANAQVAVNSFPNACGDTGYVGPSSFHAHIVAMGAPPFMAASPQVNGEVFFTVQTLRGFSATGILPAVQLVSNTTISKAYLLVNGQVISFTNGGAITSNDLIGKVCDLDALLNAMATDQVAVFIEGQYEGIAPFVATGTVHPDPTTTATLLTLYP